MIDCRDNQVEFTICDDRLTKTNDTANEGELRCRSNASGSKDQSFKTSQQLQQQPSPQQEQSTQQHQSSAQDENTGSANMSQNLEFRRPRNKSFAKVLNKRQQIREKFKNDFFSGKKSPLKSPTKEDHNHQPKVNPFTEIVKVEEEKNQSMQSLESDAQIFSANNLNIVEVEKKEEITQLKEEDMMQPIFLRIPSKTDIDDIQKDKEDNIFHVYRGGEIESFENVYELQDVLGEGCVGLVKKAVKLSDQTEYAVKIVRTRDEETIMNIKNEFLHLRELKHKNIVKVYEIYIDKTKGKIYSVMELIKGREMFEVINQLGSYSEQIAKKIFKQIVQAISYMHSKYVCHRDLKPNNILCDETGENVKITDFNVSKFCDSYKDYSHNNLPFQGIKMWTYTGTIAFSAPELFKENCYDENIDIWSAGVILYTMLCGKEPFQAEFVKDLIHKIIEGEYSFPSEPWDKISEAAKDLIKKCLTINPEDRIKPEMMLQHPWLQDDQKQKPELDRNQLGENIDRLVKGRTSSFEKNYTRRRRSNTHHIIAMNQFNTSDYMFSNKLFDNPTHTEDSDDQEEDHKHFHDHNSPIRAASYTVNERPKEQFWFDINKLQSNKAEFTNMLDEHLKKLSFLSTNNVSELNIFPNRTSSYNIMEGNEFALNSLQSPTKLQQKAKTNSVTNNNN